MTSRRPEDQEICSEPRDSLRPCTDRRVTRMASEAKKEMDAPERELCALMEGYLDGRIEAFDGLYAALSGRIRGYLLSQCRDAALADDLLQDTFMQIHRSRRTYEPGRPVTPWVFAIARHVYLMKRRSAGPPDAVRGSAGGRREIERRRRATTCARWSTKDEVRRALRPGAGGSTGGAADASRRRLELRRDRRAAGDSRQRREDARVPRHEEDAGAPEVSAPDDLRDRDRARSEADQAAAVAAGPRARRWCRSRRRSCSRCRRCISSAPTWPRSGSSAAWGFSFAQALAGMRDRRRGAARIDSGPRAVARGARRGPSPAAW